MESTPVLASSYVAPFTVRPNPETGKLEIVSGDSYGADKDPTLKSSRVGRIVATAITTFKLGNVVRKALTDENPNDAQQILRATASALGELVDLPIAELLEPRPRATPSSPDPDPAKGGEAVLAPNFWDP